MIPAALMKNLVSSLTGKLTKKQLLRLQFVILDLQVLTRRLSSRKLRKPNHLLNMMTNMTKKRKRSKKKLPQ